ncbi:2-dehydropantoate 2-reductase [Dactylosporangium darangshiense]|uniref:2-dehydropantoate 2-reductase n=1 Tax=Dactylosporangium darangshiense TaxID=579108 RepID=A0ABP8DNC8_9ACTN
MSGPRRVCVVGAGAVGAVFGARIDGPLSVLARGATLTALRERGWSLDGAVRPVTASDDPADLGEQDVVILTVKAHALPGLAPALEPLLGPGTVVVPALNGVPWWFFPDRALRSVDPDGTIAATIDRSRVIGCVVHLSAAVTAPGEAALAAGNGLILGEPDGGGSARLDAVAELLSGFDVTLSADVRRDVWYKLWGNMTVNPISALTGATADRILDDPLVNGFAHAVMREAAAIGARIGCPIEQSPVDRNAVTRRLGAFKTSMLQDAEAGRPLEIDAMLTAVREIAGALDVPTPSLDALLGLTRLAAEQRGLYQKAHD